MIDRDAYDAGFEDGFDEIQVRPTDLDTLLDPDRVGIALQATFGGYTIPTRAEGWREQEAAHTKEFVRRLREGAISDRQTP